MNQLYWCTMFTLMFALFFPYLAIMMYDDIDALKKTVAPFVLTMVGGLWLFYALIGLGRLVFGLPFIW